MGRLLQWILSNYALAALLMLAPESPVCGQNIPAFPQMIQPILDHAIHRTDIAESLLRVFTTMRGPAGIFDSLAFRHNMSVVGSGTGRPSYDSSPTVEDYGPTCKEHLSMLFKGITERKMWALKFADAVGKLPNDVLQGDLLWYGGFSSCRGISVPSLDANSSQILYQGQYCLAQIGNKTAATPTNTLTAALQLGVCMPSTCNETDTESLLNQAFSVLPEDIGVLLVHCKSKEKPLSTGAVIVILLFSVLGALIVCGTVYDVLVHNQILASLGSLMRNGQFKQEPEPVSPEGEVNEHSPLLIQSGSVDVEEPTSGVAGQILLCFSITANMKKILAVEVMKPGTLTAMHGIRLISMSWVILGHTIVFMLTSMKNPLIFIDDYFKRFSFQAIMNASVSVDTFFLLSGTLASYLMLKQIGKSGGPRNINWALVFSHRFWRLTPAYMLILGFYTTLFHHLGTGPVYPETDDPNCMKNWWQNLLYINNLFTQSEGCMGWMWYLANDMQFFIISPLIIIALYNWFVVGVVIVGALILMNILVVWILTEKHNYVADIGAFDTNRTGLMMEWFNNVYVRPYCRVGVYAIGIGLGYLLSHIPSRPRIRVLWVIAGWLLAALCCLSALYGLYGVSSNERVLPSGVNALYASVHRIVWALGVSWIIFACSTGYGGPVNTLLSWSGLVPLSRFTYMAYLIHPMVIAWVYGTNEAPVYICDTTIICMFVANLMLSYALAFILSVTLESPLIALEKLLLPQKNR